MVVGTYQQHTEVGTRLLAVLPHLLVVPEASIDAPLVALLTRELIDDQPGQQVVLDRLLDLLLVAVLRAWLARSEGAPAWYRARSDPVVGAALRLLQNNPAYPWTVASLAAATHASRAALARRGARDQAEVVVGAPLRLAHDDPAAHVTVLDRLGVRRDRRIGGWWGVPADPDGGLEVGADAAVVGHVVLDPERVSGTLPAAEHDVELGKGVVNLAGILALVKNLDDKYFYVEQETYPGTPLESVKRDYAYISQLKF